MIKGVVTYIPTQYQRNMIGGFDQVFLNAIPCKPNDDGSIDITVIKSDGTTELVQSVTQGAGEGQYQL